MDLSPPPADAPVSAPTALGGVGRLCGDERSGADSSPEIHRHADREMVRLVYANAPVGIRGGLAAAVLLAAATWPVAPVSLGVAWVAGIVTILGWRWISARSFGRANPDGASLSSWRTRFFAGALATGIAWGATSLVMVRYGNPEHLAISAFVIGGLVGGAIATMSHVPSCFQALAVPMLIMLTGAFLWKGDHVSLAMAGMTIVFLGAMLQTARQVHGVFRREVELRLANEGLVQSLTDSTDSLRSANEELTREITARRRAEEQLRLAARVFQDSVEGVVIMDPEGDVLSVNRSFTRITGYSEEDLIGGDVGLIRSGRKDFAVQASVWRALRERGFWQGELTERRKDGSQFPAWVSVSAVRDPEGSLTHFVGILSDMSRRKEAEAQIHFLAHHDALTGLPNRVLLRERFEQAAARARAAGLKVGLFFLDLDRFKSVNDSLGHMAGDELLIAASQRLRQCLRASDTVCRHHGDEFLAVVADVPTVEALANVAQKTLRCLDEPFEVSGHALTTGGSLGISVFPDHGETFEVLLQRADTAMYEAKQSGRNAFRFYTDDMAQNALELLEMQTRLRLAIEREELVLHYQPQVEMQTGRIVAVEALVRWNDPRTGLVSPAQFIPLAEETGLVVPLGAWVLREACRQVRAWIDSGLPPITVAVNLSAIQFARGNLLETVTEALQAAGLPGCSLEAELTESVLLQEQGLVVDTLHKLKGLGVQLSIDDFGTGYSSLAYLKRFAVDKLKIDQSFVRDLGRDPDDAAIVRAVIQMGRSLKLRTIAEGVETPDQLEFLRREGCEQAQGYLFSRPLPARECARLLAGRVLSRASPLRAAPVEPRPVQPGRAPYCNAGSG